MSATILVLTGSDHSCTRSTSCAPKLCSLLIHRHALPMLTDHPHTSRSHLFNVQAILLHTTLPLSPRAGTLTASHTNFLGILCILNTEGPTSAKAGTYRQDTPFLQAAKQPPGLSLAALTHTSSAWWRLGQHCQHMQAAGKGESGCTDTCLQCKEATAIVVPTHASHRRRQLGQHCQHTQTMQGNDYDCSGSTCKPCKEAIATILPMHTSNTRRQLWL